MSAVDVDVLVIGAGVSGIGAACQLVRRCPDHSFAVLERRDAIGGTWDLFRYPGVRCDSDMHTFGYGFRPWPSDRVITDGASIRAYVRETAEAYGVEAHVRFGHRVVRASWSTDEAAWTVEAVREDTGEPVVVTCRFLLSCTGYYDHDRGHLPGFDGVERFGGDVVHPQFWPDELDHAGRRVVVIGSGATAVTLVPALAQEAAHVTMLQRSPSYVVSIPEFDRISRVARRVLPDELVADLARARNLGIQLSTYHLCRRFPGLARWAIEEHVRRRVGPGVDMRHFSPRYEPWDQRLCVVPDGDLFRSLRTGRASVVTDVVETFTEAGIRLRSGRELATDLVVTATGLQLQVLGGMELLVDGERVDPTDTLTYKAVMLSDVPNFALVFGYVHVSWTRKADLVSAYVCRLLNHLRATGMQQVTPRVGDGVVTDEPFLPLDAGYVRRAADQLPRQGAAAPWRNTQQVLRDLVDLRLGRIEDGHLEFSNRAGEPARRDGVLGGLVGGLAAALGR